MKRIFRLFLFTAAFSIVAFLNLGGIIARILPQERAQDTASHNPLRYEAPDFASISSVMFKQAYASSDDWGQCMQDCTDGMGWDPEDCVEYICGWP